jgi:hypothetical protein
VYCEGGGLQHNDENAAKPFPIQRPLFIRRMQREEAKRSRRDYDLSRSIIAKVPRLVVHHDITLAYPAY